MICNTECIVWECTDDQILGRIDDVQGKEYKIIPKEI